MVDAETRPYLLGHSLHLRDGHWHIGIVGEPVDPPALSVVADNPLEGDDAAVAVVLHLGDQGVQGDGGIGDVDEGERLP